jgi:hypothetical protein
MREWPSAFFEFSARRLGLWKDGSTPRKDCTTRAFLQISYCRPLRRKSQVSTKNTTSKSPVRNKLLQHYVSGERLVDPVTMLYWTRSSVSRWSRRSLPCSRSILPRVVIKMSLDADRARIPLALYHTYVRTVR